MSGSFPSVDRVAFSAVRGRGSWSSFAVRPSSRSLSGFVAVAGFSSFRVASRFSRVWGGRVPSPCGGCCVRRVSGLFCVSVPVRPSSVPAVCFAGSPVSSVGSAAALLSVVFSSSVFRAPLPLPAPPALPAPVSLSVPAAPVRGRSAWGAWSPATLWSFAAS